MPRPVHHKPLTATTQSTEQAHDLRQSMSLPEVLLWRELKGRKIEGARFRRQHPLGSYIADFYCHEHALVIEVDGRQHSGERFERDRARDAWMSERGHRVIRFRAEDVLKDLDAVVRTIRREVRSDQTPET